MNDALQSYFSETLSKAPGLMPDSPVAQPVRDSALWTMVKIRLLEFTRKPEAVFWTYVFPLLMVGILGTAFRSQTQEAVPVAAVIGSEEPIWLASLRDAPGIDLSLLDETEAKRQLRVGKVTLILQPSPELPNAPKILVDDSRPESRLAERTVRLRLYQVATAQSGDDSIAQTVEFKEPGSRYVDFLVPGLIGMGLLGGGMWGVGYAIVDMRIRKLLKRFLATPMRRSDFLMAVIISRMCFILPEIALMLAFAIFAFGVQVYGSWLALIFLILLGGIQFCGVGLLVASRAKTTEAISGLMNLVMLPMWTLSGIFFSYERFPEVAHWPIRLLPLTPLLDALRGVMLEGRTLAELWVELLLMSAWAIVTFVVGLKVFRWNT